MAQTSIDILINAQNKASSQLADVSNSLKALSKQSAETAKKTAEAGKGGDEMSAGLGSILGTATKLVPVLAAVGAGFLAFKSLKGIISGGIEAFAIQEKAVRDLSVTLDALGDSSQDLLPDLKAYAGELQLLTNVGDEVTLGTMKRLRTLGFEADELKGATQATIGLTAAFGSQEAAAEAVAKAHEGDFDALKEKIPALREATTLAEKTAIVNEAAAAGFLVASEGTKTMGGALTALNNAWGDTLESVGELLAPYITRIADMFNRIAPLIQEKIGLLLPIMEHIAQRAAEISYWLFEQLVKGYTMIETVIMNFGDTVNLIWTSIKLSVLTLVNDIVYFFTERLPQIGQWFAENWTNLFRDMFVAIGTFYLNYIKMIMNNFVILFKFIKSGMTGGMGQLMTDLGENMGQNLLDGFEAKTKPLPDAIARGMTAGEKKLQTKATDLATGLVNTYNEKVDERLGFFGDVFSAELGAGAKPFEGIGITQGAKDRDKEKNEGKGGKLAAAESRFLTRGSGEVSAEEQMVEEQKQSKALIAEVASGMSQAVGFLQTISAQDVGDAIEVIKSNKGG